MREYVLTGVLVMLLVIAWSGYTYVRGAYFAVGQIGRALVWDTISAVVSVGLLVGVVLFGAGAGSQAPHREHP